MPDLLPIFEMPQLVEDQAEIADSLAPFYGTGLFFDFERGDFVLDGRRDLVKTDGHTAWAHWCVKTTLTERYAYPIYTWNHGTEIDAALKENRREATEADMRRSITEALLNDPRTLKVDNFSFVWVNNPVTADQSVLVAFTATPVIGNPERIEVRLNG